MKTQSGKQGEKKEKSIQGLLREEIIVWWHGEDLCLLKSSSLNKQKKIKNHFFDLLWRIPSLSLSQISLPS